MPVFDLGHGITADIDANEITLTGDLSDDPITLTMAQFETLCRLVNEQREKEGRS